jgi:hypothetical protein
MVQSPPISDLTLNEVKSQFGLQEATDQQFFGEWLEALPELAEAEQRSLDQVKANFTYLNQYQLSEESVKLVVLSPLLSMAGFYAPPFRLRTEATVQIAAEDEGTLYRGRIDVLVLQERLWVLVIESKEQ